MSILIFFIVLSILVLVHEFGHFIMAKRAGILVEEFGFGLPPRIYGKQVGETLYSINLLPFGGFVKLYGESNDETVDSARAFSSKSKLQRILVIVAGVFMNFILAIVAFGIVYSFTGVPKETNNVKIVDVSASSPAQTAGLLPGDTVKTVDGVNVTSVKSFINLVEQKKGKQIKIMFVRTQNGQDQTLNVSVTPRESPPPDQGALGVTISTTEIYFAPVWQRPFIGAYYGFKDAIFWGWTVLQGLGSIFTSLFARQVPKGLSGPVGIYAVTTEAAKFGILSLINLLGILSVNLAILNILPFPALDGGRLLFIGIEAIAGRKVLPKLENTINTIGMILLLTLILALTAHDVFGLIKAGSISNFLNTLTK